MEILHTYNDFSLGNINNRLMKKGVSFNWDDTYHFEKILKKKERKKVLGASNSHIKKAIFDMCKSHGSLAKHPVRQE